MLYTSFWHIAVGHETDLYPLVVSIFELTELTIVSRDLSFRTDKAATILYTSGWYLITYYIYGEV